MLSQEKLYQHIFKEEWSPILSLLHKERKDIATDTLLTQAATIFEQEFFKKIGDYPLGQASIIDNLDTLYILNHGKFYMLREENYKRLILEIVKRKPVEQAADYAKAFPDDEVCKNVLQQFSKMKESKSTFINESKTQFSMNLIEIFNRLFELINNQSDAATYFSGPRFINTVREFAPYYPDYNQYIGIRNQEGKSTSRKVFYYDILLELREDLRLKVITRILEIVKPHEESKASIIEELLGRKKPTQSETAHDTPPAPTGNPVVFISYSWDNETHKEWVINLAARLRTNGVDVILDRYYLKPGRNLPHFVEQSIAKAERIIIVFTPNYKLKADKREGGVGYEYSIMNADLYNHQSTNEKVIPLLRSGSKEDSIPLFLQQFIHIDIRQDSDFEEKYSDLIREIYNEPIINMPELGSKPSFEKHTAINVEKPEIGSMPNFKSEIKGVINPEIVARIRFNDTPVLTLLDGTEINAGTIRIEDNHLVHYTGKGLREMWKPDMTPEESKKAEELKSNTEQYLTEHDYIAWTPLDQIKNINR